MKKLLFLLIFSTLSLSLQAQYIINKEIYNSKDYIYQTGDKYKPAVAGTLSFFLNGAGQLYTHEPKRAFGFFVGGVASYASFVWGVYGAIDGVSYFTGYEIEPLFFVGAGIAGAIGFKIGAICDAVKVAKVNNMALREQPQSLINWKLEPKVNTFCLPNQRVTTVGLSLKIPLN